MIQTPNSVARAIIDNSLWYAYDKQRPMTWWKLTTNSISTLANIRGPLPAAYMSELQFELRQLGVVSFPIDQITWGFTYVEALKDWIRITTTRVEERGPFPNEVDEGAPAFEVPNDELMILFRIMKYAAVQTFTDAQVVAIVQSDVLQFLENMDLPPAQGQARTILVARDLTLNDPILHDWKFMARLFSWIRDTVLPRRLNGPNAQYLKQTLSRLEQHTLKRHNSGSWQDQMLRAHIDANPGTAIVVLTKDEHEVQLSNVARDHDSRLDLAVMQLPSKLDSTAMTTSRSYQDLSQGKAGLYFIRASVVPGIPPVNVHIQVLCLMESYPDVPLKYHFPYAEVFQLEVPKTSTLKLHEKFGDRESWSVAHLTQATKMVMTHILETSLPDYVQDAETRINEVGITSLATNPRSWSFVITIMNWLRREPNRGLTNDDRLIMLAIIDELQARVNGEDTLISAKSRRANQ